MKRSRPSGRHRADRAAQHAAHLEGLRPICECPPDPRGPLFTKHADDCPRRPLARFEELHRG